MSLETVDPAISTLVYGCAVDANSEGWSKQTEKCPIEPVIDKVAALVWTFEKFGTIASSATAGSSNESVPGKNRLLAIPWACAEWIPPSMATTTSKRPGNMMIIPSLGLRLIIRTG